MRTVKTVKMETRFIYSLNDPITNIPMYIGSTKNLRKRLSNHLCDTHNKSKLNWTSELKNSGLGPIIEQIDEVPIAESNFWEEHYISLFKSWGFPLLNGHSRAIGIFGHSEEARKKMSLDRKGNVTQKAKNRFISAMMRPDVRKRAADKWKQNGSLYKSVAQYDLEGNFIRTFKSISEAAKETNASISVIIRSCKREMFVSANSMWRYFDGNIIEKISPYQNKQDKPVNQYDLNGIFIKRWNSIIAAAKSVKVDPSCIQACCSGKKGSKTSRGFIWKYDNNLI